MLKLGASVTVGGTVNNYNALQIAMYLNLDVVVSCIVNYSVARPPWSCTTQLPYQSSLIELLVSGYYRKDPENKIAQLPSDDDGDDISTEDTQCVSSFIRCLFLIDRKNANDPYTAQRRDPLQFEDKYGKTVMDYLQTANGLSRDFPRDWKLPEHEKVYDLRNLFVELHGIMISNMPHTLRYKSFMSSSLYSKEWKLPMPLELRNEMFMQSLGEKIQKRNRAIALHRDQMKAWEIEYGSRAYESCMGDFASCALHPKDGLLTVSDNVHGDMAMQRARVGVFDPLFAGRANALARHRFILNIKPLG